MRDAVYVLGVGMVPFRKPGASESYDAMGAAAARDAASDAGIDYSLVRQAYVGYVYGDSTCGQAALYRDVLARLLVRLDRCRCRAQPVPDRDVRVLAPDHPIWNATA